MFNTKWVCLAGAAWLAVGSQALCAQEAEARPKNVIVMIGDGMGFNQVESASLYAYGAPEGQPYWGFQRLAVSTYSTTNPDGYDPAKAWEDFDYFERLPTDSAAAATALSTGVKVRNGQVGTSPEDEPLKHLIEYAEEMGKATGVLSTVYLSHATPASFVAHVDSRAKNEEIAQQMILGSAVDVMIAPGHPWFDDNGQQVGGFEADPYATEGSYSRIGGEALWRDLKAGTAGGDADGDGTADPWVLVDTSQGIKDLKQGTAPRRVLGVVPVAATLQVNRDGDKSAGPFEVPAIQDMPTMADLAAGALNVLSQDPEGFFLMAEGGAIDWAGHGNQLGRLIEEQRDFDLAIEAVIAWVEAHGGWEETLLIITADHETGYLLGPASNPEWHPLKNNGKGKTPGVEFMIKSHTNQLVPLFAKGAGAGSLLAKIRGEDKRWGPFVDNTDIPVCIRAVWR